MKSIIKSLLVITAVAAVAGGATYAYFSSQATVLGSTFSAGTMDIKVDANPNPDFQQWESSFTVPSDYFVKNLYPGYPAKGEHNWQVLDIKNDSTVDGNATIKFDVTSWSTSAMGDDLNFTVYYDGENNGFGDNPTAIASGSLAEWNHNVYSLGVLSANKIASVKIVWSVPASAGNEIQGASVILDTTFGLDQVH
jgi:predicted ribosomally synthesized peptide with SipW-like signal peptide